MMQMKSLAHYFESNYPNEFSVSNTELCKGEHLLKEFVQLPV